MIINSESNQDQNWALLKKIIKPTLLISLIITIIFILSINFIEIYVFNNKYNLTFYSILLSPNIIILYLALCYGSILYTKHYYRQKVKYMGITVLINLILNLFFLPLIGIYSLLISTLFSNIYLLISYRKYFYEELQR